MTEKKIIRVQLKGGPILDDIGVKGKTKAAAITPEDTADNVFNTIRKQILKGVEPDIVPKLEREIKDYRLATVTGDPEAVFEPLDPSEKLFPKASICEFYFISPKFLNKPVREDPTPAGKKKKDSKKLKKQNSSSKISLLDRSSSLGGSSAPPQPLEQKDIIFLSMPQTNSVEIKAASLDKLVEFLTHESYIDPRFRDTFLLTYRSFTTGSELFAKLVERFRAGNLPTPLQTKRRIRILSVLKAWVESHFRDFEQDSQLTDDFLVFVKGEMKELMSSSADKLSKSYEKAKKENVQKKEEERRGEEVEEGEGEPVGDWIKLDSKMLAEHITVLESNYYCAITPKECIAYFKKKGEAHNITAMVSQFNCFSEWVVTQMCTTIRLADRIVKFEKLVSICNELYNLQNFNGVMEILSGLNNAAVRRMKATRAGASKETLLTLKKIETQMSHEHSYTKLRQLLSTVDNPAIPYLGMYMSDMVFTEDGNKDMLDGLINFHKRTMLGEIINKICQFQVTYHRTILSKNKRTILDFLQNLPALPDQDCYNMSIFIEPKDGKYENAIEKAIQKEEKKIDQLLSLKQKLKELEKELAVLQHKELPQEDEKENKKDNQSSWEATVKASLPPPPTHFAHLEPEEEGEIIIMAACVAPQPSGAPSPQRAPPANPPGLAHQGSSSRLILPSPRKEEKEKEGSGHLPMLKSRSSLALGRKREDDTRGSKSKEEKKEEKKERGVRRSVKLGFGLARGSLNS